MFWLASLNLFPGLSFPQHEISLRQLFLCLLAVISEHVATLSKEFHFLICFSMPACHSPVYSGNCCVNPSTLVSHVPVFPILCFSMQPLTFYGTSFPQLVFFTRIVCTCYLSFTLAYNRKAKLKP